MICIQLNPDFINNRLLERLSRSDHKMYTVTVPHYRALFTSAKENDDLIYDYLPISSNVPELTDILNEELNQDYDRDYIEHLMKRGELQLGLIKEPVYEFIYENINYLETLNSGRAESVINSAALINKVKNKKVVLTIENNINEIVIVESPNIVNIIVQENARLFNINSIDHDGNYYEYYNNITITSHKVDDDNSITVMRNKVISVIKMNHLTKTLHSQYTREYSEKIQLVEDIRDTIHRTLIRITELRSLINNTKEYTVDDLDNVLSKIKQIPKVKEVALINSQLVVRTDLLYIPNGDVIYISGIYDIVIDFYSLNRRAFSDIKFINRLLRIEAYGGHDGHPHVINSNDTACLGTWSAPLEQYYSLEHIDVLIHYCIRFLQSVDPEDSAGSYIKYWPIKGDLSVHSHVESAHQVPLSADRTHAFVSGRFNEDDDEDYDEE